MGLSSYPINKCFNLSLWWRILRCILQDSLESCQQYIIHLSTMVIRSTFHLCINCLTFLVLLFATVFLCLGLLPKLKILAFKIFPQAPLLGQPRLRARLNLALERIISGANFRTGSSRWLVSGSIMTLLLGVGLKMWPLMCNYFTVI